MSSEIPKEHGITGGLESPQWILRIPTVVALLLFAITCLASWLLYQANESRLESTFALRTKNVSNGLRENLLFAEQTIRAMANLFETSEQVTPYSFAKVAAEQVPSFLGIQALEWVPKVPKHEREAFEQAVSEAGHEGFALKQWQREGGWKKASDQWADEYYPVHFLYPMEGNEEAFGIDLGSHPSRRDAINRAISRGEIVATAKVTLVQEKENQAGFLLLAPVRDKGFSLGVFRVGDLVEGVLASRDIDGLELRITDYSADDGKAQLLYESPGYASNKDPRWNADYPHHIGGRNWNFAWNYHPDFVAAERGWDAWLVLSLGSLLSCLLGTVFRQHVNRRIQVEKLADERTEQLANSEESIRRTFEASPNGLVIVEKSGKISMVNPQMTELFGYQSEEMLGQSIEMLVPERYQEQHVVDRIGYHKTRKTRMMGSGRDLSGLRKDNTEFPAEIGLTPLDIACGRTLATINDISERKRHERFVERKNEQLSRLNTELIEFGYSTSHDLKAPLASITGLLGFCESDLDDGEVEEVRSNIQKAKDLAERLANRVESTLNLAKSDMEEGETETIAVQQRVSDAWHSLPHEGVALETSFEHLDPVQSVSVRFDAILENLLSNAIKYQDPEQLEKVVRVSTWSSDGQFHLSVEDNGIGIPQEYQDKVFRLFHRLASHDKSGTGLGLPLVKKSITRLGGQIELQSSNGTTTFTVSLPQAAALSLVEGR